MKQAERIPDYLQHIIVACNRVARYAEGNDEQSFAADIFTQDAILRAMHVIGEAAVRVRRADEDFMEEYGLTAFTKAIGVRNRLSHEYDQVDLEVTWDTVRDHVPALRQKVIDVLYELGHRPDLDALHF